ncbi:efflux RND transporter periplasmic adaptor subunit [Aquisalimonas asiatica]|uniref:Membrane fusion protein, multidrug efflux system n=1 Tax=Aquisalimonas asiatica TaxID=406100 RepID=A0A1H8UW75_9GAMM|nr:efflux RND transporter periplasmic adaptor subunit [Aquisalimonas asiatica]SEP07396.1 membrane fusion protein, multidrug efflux system [Aquisalimonas asiatica]
MQNRMRWVIQFVVVALIAVAAAGGWIWLGQAGNGDDADGAGGRGPGGALPVEVARAERRQVQDTVQAVGTMLARESVEIVTEVAGRIVEAPVREGQQVEAGEPLFILDQVREQADLREARAQRDDARNRYRRSVALYEERDVPEAEVDERRAALESAEARVEVAESRLRDRTITAPFDGIVGLREVSPGAYVEPGTLLTTLDDLSVVRLDFSVPERFLSGLVPGLDVQARSLGYGDEVFAGEVARLSSRIDPITRSLRVQAEFDNEEGRLRAGMFMTARLVLAEREALMVPEESVLKEGTGSYVFVIVDDQARRIEVTTGRREGGYVEVTGDLADADDVVIAGLQTVRDGADVRVLNEGEEGDHGDMAAR